MKRNLLLLLMLAMLTPRAMAAEFYAVYDLGTLTFYYDDERSSRSGRVYTTPEEWQEAASGTIKVVFDESVAGDERGEDPYLPTSTANWFLNFAQLKKIEGLEYLNTSRVTEMYSMFASCASLTSLNLLGFNTESVTNMSAMFADCSSLKSLNLNSFDTSNVKGMVSMFIDCQGLRELDLSHFDVSNVEDMTSMFRGCYSLTHLDLSYWHPDRIANAKSMFDGCSALDHIYCQYDWYELTSKANCTDMFKNCYATFVKPSSTKSITIGGERIFRPGQVNLPFIEEGTVTYSEDDYVYGYPTLTLEDAVIIVEDGEGIVTPGEGVVLVLKGENTITSLGTGIYSTDIFTIGDGSLEINSLTSYGIRMADGGCLSANEGEDYNMLYVYGRNGAIRGQKKWLDSQKKYVSPSILAHKMMLAMMGDGINPVIKGLSDITDATTSSGLGKVRYSYDSYSYDKEKQTVVTSPSGNVVTKTFVIAPQESFEYCGVYLGGEQMNNWNYGNFEPMSLTQGSVEYDPDDYSLYLHNARFDYPYWSTDDLYALQGWKVPELAVYVEGDCSLTGTLEDNEYGLMFSADGSETARKPQYVIRRGNESKASLSLRGTFYFQSTDYPGAGVFFEDIAINVTDGAYMWGEDDIDVHIYNSDFTLVNDCYSDQPIIESLNSLTLENCTLMDGCYWDSNEGCVKDRNGERATRLVRIVRDRVVGDLNNDGKVDIADAVTVLNIMASNEFNPAANLNGDDKVDIADFVTILNIMAAQ